MEDEDVPDPVPRAAEVRGTAEGVGGEERAYADVMAAQEALRREARMAGAGNAYREEIEGALAGLTWRLATGQVVAVGLRWNEARRLAVNMLMGYFDAVSAADAEHQSQLRTLVTLWVLLHDRSVWEWPLADLGGAALMCRRGLWATQVLDWVNAEFPAAPEAPDRMAEAEELIRRIHDLHYSTRVVSDESRTTPDAPGN